ncbi:uncharacterized protein [Amphiura filiformis]|uniref:uncharacterized protein n=1 Tax=Amphiura filiformis TaxID=82378 RepID=UPI003B226269
MERSVVDGNDEDGIATSFVLPDTTNIPRHRFCSFQYNLTENVVLYYDQRDVEVDRYECFQVLQSPPGSTITVYIVSGIDPYSYTLLNFWNGYSTTQDDLISTRGIEDVYGHPISSTTNAMSIEVPESAFSIPSLTLLITIQSSVDYDLALNNVHVTNNALNGLDVSMSNRKLLITDSFLAGNGENGLILGESYGELIMGNTVSENNGQSGIDVVTDFNKVDIDECSFLNNTFHGISIGIEGTPNHATHLSIRSSSVSDNGANGILVTQCGSSSQQVVLENCCMSWNSEGGVSLTYENFCNSSGDLFTTVKENNVIGNTNYGISVNFEQFVGGFTETYITNNIFEENRNSFSVLDIRFNDQYDSFQGLFQVSGNTFTANEPRIYLAHLNHILKVATVIFNNPSALVIGNVFNNLLFPTELMVVGEHHGQNVNATGNWWGTTDEVQIQERIYDFSDRYEFGTIDYFPYLLSSDGSNVVSDDSPRENLAFQRNNIIGGVVNETFYLSGTDYTTDRDIIVPDDGQLVIQPGVTIHFAPYTSLFVKGKLVAEGNIENQISLVPYQHNEPAIRLVDGINQWNGRLELFVNDAWHTVCGNDWTFENAMVACFQLGFYGVVNSHYLSVSQGTGQIWNHQVSCTGTESNLQLCDIDEGIGICGDHSMDVAIECRKPEWGGLFFPLGKSQSILSNVVIRDAGYKLQWKTNVGIIGREAILVHMHHHMFENISIESPALVGMEVLIPAPFYDNNFIGINVTSCNPDKEFLEPEEVGVRFSNIVNGISLETIDIDHCFNALKLGDDNGVPLLQSDFVKYVDMDQIVDTCNGSRTANADDFVLVFPPPQAEHYHTCTDIITSSAGNRLGVAVLLIDPDTSVAVEEYGNTTLYIDGEQPYKYQRSIISNGDEVTIRRQSYNDARYVVVVADINEGNVISSSQSSKLISIRNSQVVNSENGFHFSRCVNFQLLITDASFMDVEFGIQATESFIQDQPNVISNTDFQSNISRSTAIKVDESLTLRSDRLWIITNSVMENYNNGISFTKLRDAAANDGIFHRSVRIEQSQFSADYQAISIRVHLDNFGSILDFQDDVYVDGCIFQGCSYGIDIDRDIYSYENNPINGSVSDVIENSQFSDGQYAISVNTGIHEHLDELQTQLIVTNCDIQSYDIGIRGYSYGDFYGSSNGIQSNLNTILVEDSEFSSMYGHNSITITSHSYGHGISSQQDTNTWIIRNCKFMQKFGDAVSIYYSKDSFGDHYDDSDTIYDPFPRYSLVFENCDFRSDFSPERAITVNLQNDIFEFGFYTSEYQTSDVVRNEFVVRNCTFINYEYPLYSIIGMNICNRMIITDFREQLKTHNFMVIVKADQLYG